MTNIISLIFINLVTPKAGTKHEPSFNKPASGLVYVGEVWRDDTRYNGIQHNDTQHNDTQHKRYFGDTVIMLNIIFAQCLKYAVYAECY
jgi:hypothetical protein